MQLVESWLKSCIDTELTGESLAHVLTMAGLEVEEVAPLVPVFSGVVVAKVLSKTKHPDADRLSVCQVQVLPDPEMPGAVLQIVCGAANVAPGIVVPCALEGAVLPGGFGIKRAKMRGVESQGMLCAAQELGMPFETDGLWVLTESSDTDLPIGADIRAALGLNDIRHTIKLTPNRADCLSMRGIARELSALMKASGSKPAQLLDAKVPNIAEQHSTVVPVVIEAPNLCGRFLNRVVRGVNNHAKTPAWMRQRLEALGQRSISPLVDITNYVMLEWGQPSHVYDLQRLQGGLTVRYAKAGDMLTVLGGKTIALAEHVGVVCDEEGPVAIAGIMGGEPTAVSVDTIDVLIEVAFWHPEAIAGRARDLQCASESSHRFERGVDYAQCAVQLARITELIQLCCGGAAGPVTETLGQLPSKAPVVLRHQRAEQVLGFALVEDFVVQSLQSLGCECTVIPAAEPKGIAYQVQVPTYRFDLQIEEDLIEELIRLKGYDTLPNQPAVGQMRLGAGGLGKTAMDVKRSMAGLGFQEVMSYSFTPKDWEQSCAGDIKPIAVLNPIASRLEVMRSTLLPSLLGVLQHNMKHRNERVKIFEWSRVFYADAAVLDGPLTVEGIAQPLRLASLVFGSHATLQWAVPPRAFDFFDLKGDVEQLLSRFGFDGAGLEFVPGPKAKALVDHEPILRSLKALHPGRSAGICHNGVWLGVLGELHPQLTQQFELSGHVSPILFELDGHALLQQIECQPASIYKQPVVQRDLAFVVNKSLSAHDLKKALWLGTEGHPAWLKSVILFDEFASNNAANGLNSNEKSLAFRLLFQDTQQSLTDFMLESLLLAIVDSAVKHCNARLR